MSEQSCLIVRDNSNKVLSPKELALKYFSEDIDSDFIQNVNEVLNTYLEDKPEISYVASLTPYAGDRIPRYNELNKIINLGRGSKDPRLIEEAQKALAKMQEEILFRIRRIIPDSSINIVPVTGYWQGNLETSFNLEFSEMNDDIRAALAKLGEEFDQDEIHIRSINEIDNEKPFLEVDKDGGMQTMGIILTIDDPDIMKQLMSNNRDVNLTGKYGFDGATILNNNQIVVYIAENQISTGKTNNEIIEEFFKNLKKIKDDFRGSAKIGSGVFGQRLFRYAKNGREGVSRSYKEVYGDNDKVSRIVQERLKGKTEIADRSTWAKMALSNAQLLILNQKIEDKSIDVGRLVKTKRDEIIRFFANGPILNKTKDMERVGRAFDALPDISDDPLVEEAFSYLSEYLKEQYKQLPIKVVPNSIPLQLPNGDIIWQEMISPPYNTREDVLNDISNNNQMVFMPTNADKFGNPNLDMSFHPLLGDSGFRSLPIPIRSIVLNEDGTPKIENGQYVVGDIIKDKNGYVINEGYPLKNNDLLRIVYDFIGHSATDTDYSVNNNIVAWERMMGLILNNNKLTDEQKILAALAFTTEIRGPFDSDNITNKYNDFINYNLQKAYDLDKKIKELEEEYIRNKRDSYKKKLESDIASLMEESNRIKQQYGYIKGLEYAYSKFALLPFDTLFKKHGEESINNDILERLYEDNIEFIDSLTNKFIEEYTNPESSASNLLKAITQLDYDVIQDVIDSLKEEFYFEKKLTKEEKDKKVFYIDRFNEQDQDKIQIAYLYAENIGIPQYKLDYMGRGVYGHAFDTGDGRVIKVTSSKSEAFLSAQLIGQDFGVNNIIYDVINVGNYYVILQEKTDTKNIEYHDIGFNMFKQVFGIYDNESLLKIDIDNEEFWENIYEKVKAYYESLYKDSSDKIKDKYTLEQFVEEHYNRIIESKNYIKGMQNIMKFYKETGLLKTNDVHKGNIGFDKNEVLKTFDIDNLTKTISYQDLNDIIINNSSFTELMVKIYEKYKHNNKKDNSGYVNFILSKISSLIKENKISKYDYDQLNKNVNDLYSEYKQEKKYEEEDQQQQELVDYDHVSIRNDIEDLIFKKRIEEINKLQKENPLIKSRLKQPININLYFYDENGKDVTLAIHEFYDGTKKVKKTVDYQEDFYISVDNNKSISDILQEYNVPDDAFIEKRKEKLDPIIKSINEKYENQQLLSINEFIDLYKDDPDAKDIIEKINRLLEQQKETLKGDISDDTQFLNVEDLTMGIKNIYLSELNKSCNI